MSKSTNFSGQPIFNQIIKFIDKVEIKRISREHQADRYVKKFSTYNHLIVMLFVAFEGYHSIREVITGLLANSQRLIHLGLSYIIKRSTFSEANQRRSSQVFGDIYMGIYRRYGSSLADSRLSNIDLKRLFIMDATTISLFSVILKGAGRNPKQGKKKGGIKAHTIINASEDVPCLVRYSEAAVNDHMFLKEAMSLEPGSIITFDKGYVAYSKYQEFTERSIWYVTRLRERAIYEARKEFSIPDGCASKVRKDEEITLAHGEKKAQIHRSRHIVYWDSENNRLFDFITNNFELSAEQIAQIYKKRWQIETLFKRIKQNFPLKYFLGDNQNAIEIQIWAAMLANLLITLVKNQVKRKWAFSNMVSLVRQQLMNYIDIYKFLEDPEGSWRAKVKDRNDKYSSSLFPELGGAYL